MTKHVKNEKCSFPFFLNAGNPDWSVFHRFPFFLNHQIHLQAPQALLGKIVGEYFPARSAGKFLGGYFRREAPEICWGYTFRGKIRANRARGCFSFMFVFLKSAQPVFS